MTPFSVTAKEVAAFKRSVTDPGAATDEEHEISSDLIHRMWYAGFGLDQMYEFLVGDDDVPEWMRVPQ